MTDIYENGSEVEVAISEPDPCVECGEAFTARDWTEAHSYGLQGDVHAECCRSLDCIEHDLECE